MQQWIDQQMKQMRQGWRDPKWSEDEYMEYQNYGPANRRDIRGLMEAAAAQGIGRKGLNTIMSKPFLSNVDMGGGSREGSIMDYLATQPDMLRQVLRQTRQGDYPAPSDSNWGGGQTSLFDAHPELHHIYSLGMWGEGGAQGTAAPWMQDAYTWGMEQGEDSPWAQQAQNVRDYVEPLLDDPMGRIGSFDEKNDWRTAFGLDPVVRPVRPPSMGNPGGGGQPPAPGAPGTPPVPGGPGSPPPGSPGYPTGNGFGQQQNPFSFSFGQAGDQLLNQLYPWAQWSWEQPSWQYQGDANAKGGPGNRNPWQSDYPGGSFNPWQSNYPGGLPLSGDSEAWRRAVTDRLQNDLGMMTYQKNQIMPMLQQGMQRMATDYEGARDRLGQSYVDRGIYDSGIRESGMAEQQQMFNRAVQDQVMAGQQAMGQANYGISDAWLQYYQQMAERALAATQGAYSNPNTPVRF
jgi:hypothetical protein